MKLLTFSLLISFNFLYPASVVASPTSLTCTETSATDTETQDRYIFINAEAGTAMVGGEPRELYVKPNQYRLISVQIEPFFFMTVFEINRTTLEFTTTTKGDNTERKSSGLCKITPTAAGAQI